MNIKLRSRQFQSTLFVILAYTRFRCLDAVSCYQSHIKLFCCPALNSQHRSVTRPVLQLLVILLVLTRLDYSSWPLLSWRVSYSTDFSLSVMNAAARLVFSVCKHDHVTLLLHDLHCLRAPPTIKYRLGSAGVPLSTWNGSTIVIGSLVSIWRCFRTIPVVVNDGRHWSCLGWNVQQSVTVRFQ